MEGDAMPKYEYKCAKCGVFEKTHPITQDALSECPYCGGKITRLISKNVNVIYKGSGFYTTEYGKQDNSKKKTKKEASPNAEGKNEKNREKDNNVEKSSNF